MNSGFVIASARKASLSLGLLLCAALALLTGCSFSAPHMRPGTPRAITADPGAATVVFVRPARLGGAITSAIATGQGRFLGETEAHSYFVTKLPPGDHLLVSWSESTPALRASLAAGRIYYVEVAPKMGFGSARVQLLALGPRRAKWDKLSEWMAECSPIEPDEPAGQAYFRDRGGDLADRIRAAEEHYQGYSPEDRDERTLRPEDGVAGPLGATPAGPAPSTPPVAAPAPAAARSGGVDTVILKSGGRLRGTVMEDEPTRISIKLIDGTTKVLRRTEVERVDYAR